MTLVGVLKQAEKRNTFSPVNRPETRQLLWAEKAAMLEAAGCAGGEGSVIFVEAVGEAFWSCCKRLRSGDIFVIGELLASCWDYSTVG